MLLAYMGRFIRSSIHATIYSVNMLCLSFAEKRDQCWSLVNQLQDLLIALTAMRGSARNASTLYARVDEVDVNCILCTAMLHHGCL